MARIDYVDLVDRNAAIFGGTQLMYIAGANWFLNNNLVIKLDYTRADVTDALDNTVRTNAQGKARINAFNARVQMDW